MARRETGKPTVATSATSATRAGNQWGIPDWRDAAAYGDVKRWTFNRWRWEFYRRRADLREYFDAGAEETYRHWRRYAGKEGFPAAHLRPDEPGFCAMVDVEARARFGYSGLPNPRIGEQPCDVIKPYTTDGTIKSQQGDATGHNDFRGTLQELLSRAGVVLSDEQAFLLAHSLGKLPLGLKAHETAVIFDLNRPLQAQLAQARNLLVWEQKGRHGKPLQTRRHPAKWLGYLRALDAREAGASWAIITEAFFAEGLLDRRKNPSGGYRAPDAQAARDVWKAADALRFNF